jgi:hypothetical protein
MMVMVVMMMVMMMVVVVMTIMAAPPGVLRQLRLSVRLARCSLRVLGFEHC